jgi:DNA-binding MarR family transcriptional regulator
MSPPETAGRPGGRDDVRLGPWRTFLTAHAHVTRRLDEELRAEHGLSLAEYEALLQIAYAPNRRLRMSQLAERVLLSRSGVTRLIDRLVADALVERSSCSEDARGAEAVLTAGGMERLREASRTHLRGVDEYFVSVVPQSDLEMLETTLAVISDRAAPRTGQHERCSQSGSVRGSVQRTR